MIENPSVQKSLALQQQQPLKQQQQQQQQQHQFQQNSAIRAHSSLPQGSSQRINNDLHGGSKQSSNTSYILRSTGRIASTQNSFYNNPAPLTIKNPVSKQSAQQFPLQPITPTGLSDFPVNLTVSTSLNQVQVQQQQSNFQQEQQKQQQVNKKRHSTDIAQKLSTLNDESIVQLKTIDLFNQSIVAWAENEEQLLMGRNNNTTQQQSFQQRHLGLKNTLYNIEGTSSGNSHQNNSISNHPRISSVLGGEKKYPINEYSIAQLKRQQQHYHQQQQPHHYNSRRVITEGLEPSTNHSYSSQQPLQSYQHQYQSQMTQQHSQDISSSSSSALSIHGLDQPIFEQLKQQPRLASQIKKRSVTEIECVRVTQNIAQQMQSNFQYVLPHSQQLPFMFSTNASENNNQSTTTVVGGRKSQGITTQSNTQSVSLKSVPSTFSNPNDKSDHTELPFNSEQSSQSQQPLSQQQQQYQSRNIVHAISMERKQQHAQQQQTSQTHINSDVYHRQPDWPFPNQQKKQYPSASLTESPSPPPRENNVLNEIEIIPSNKRNRFQQYSHSNAQNAHLLPSMPITSINNNTQQQQQFSQKRSKTSKESSFLLSNSVNQQCVTDQTKKSYKAKKSAQQPQQQQNVNSTVTTNRSLSRNTVLAIKGNPAHLLTPLTHVPRTFDSSTTTAAHISHNNPSSCNTSLYSTSANNIINTTHTSTTPSISMNSFCNSNNQSHNYSYNIENSPPEKYKAFMENADLNEIKDVLPAVTANSTTGHVSATTVATTTNSSDSQQELQQLQQTFSAVDVGMKSSEDDRFEYLPLQSQASTLFQQNSMNSPKKFTSSNVGRTATENSFLASAKKNNTTKSACAITTSKKKQEQKKKSTNNNTNNPIRIERIKQEFDAMLSHQQQQLQIQRLITEADSESNKNEFDYEIAENLQEPSIALSKSSVCFGELEQTGRFGCLFEDESKNQQSFASPSLPSKQISSIAQPTIMISTQVPSQNNEAPQTQGKNNKYNLQQKYRERRSMSTTPTGTSQQSRTYEIPIDIEHQVISTRAAGGTTKFGGQDVAQLMLKQQSQLQLQQLQLQQQQQTQQKYQQQQQQQQFKQTIPMKQGTLLSNYNFPLANMYPTSQTSVGIANSVVAAVPFMSQSTSTYGTVPNQILVAGSATGSLRSNLRSGGDSSDLRGIGAQKKVSSAVTGTRKNGFYQQGEFGGDSSANFASTSTGNAAAAVAVGSGMIASDDLNGGLVVIRARTSSNRFPREIFTPNVQKAKRINSTCSSGKQQSQQYSQLQSSMHHFN